MNAAAIYAVEGVLLVSITSDITKSMTNSNIQSPLLERLSRMGINTPCIFKCLENIVLCTNSR